MAASRRSLLTGLSLAGGAALLAGGAYFALAPHGPSAPPPSLIGGRFHLTDQEGRAVSDEDFFGEPTLVFFGYTHCPDVCPTTLFEISEILRKLKPGEKARGLFITVDPERDTPALMKDYLSSFDNRIVGLSGDRPSIDAAMKAYRVYARKVPGEGGDYTMDHSALVYLMDKQMRFVNALNLGDPDKAAREIERWM